MVKKTLIKKYNAEIHSQSAIDAVLEIRAQESFDINNIKKVKLFTFDVAFSIIGGGEEGDHSLPYMLSAALLD